MTEDRYLKILGELNVQMRNALIFMAETGCRNIEFRKLKWSDVDLERETVKLTSQKGKGGSASSRTIPLSQMIVKILAQIRENSSSDYVFPGRTGGVQSKGALALAVRRARQRLGIGEPVSPYGLRHRMATELAKKNLEVARIVLGHSSIETTQGYLHIADDTVKNELESISIYNQSVTGQPNNDFLLH